MRHDQRGPIDRLDDVGHGERFARARYAHEHLVLLAFGEPGDEFLDGLRLIAGRFERSFELDHEGILAATARIDHGDPAVG